MGYPVVKKGIKIDIICDVLTSPNAQFKLVNTKAWLTCVALSYVGGTRGPKPVTFIEQILSTNPDRTDFMFGCQT